MLENIVESFLGSLGHAGGKISLQYLLGSVFIKVDEN